MKVKKDIIIRTVIEGVTMLCSVAAILIYAAAVGEMDDDPMDEGGFFAPMMVNLPTYTPTASSYVAPIVSSSSHVTGPKVAHRSFSSQLSDGVGAASGISAGSSMSYGGGWSSGVHITQVATGGPGGDGYGGGGGGGTGSSSSSGSSTHNYASVHIPMLNLGNGTFTTVASGIGHGKGPHLAGETADGGLYTGDAPGEITGTETQNLDNPIVNSYGQPIGDALLPLLLFAILYFIIKRKSMVQIISHTLLLSKRSRACLWVLCALLLFPCTRAWAFVDYQDYDGDDVNEEYNVVYLNIGASTNGNGEKATPTNSWANAYKKLPNYTGTTDADRDEAWDHNIIVVLNKNTALIQIDETMAKGNGTQGIPATITGVWPWTAGNTTATNVTTNGGMVTLHNHVDPSSTASNNPTRIGADTKFKYIRFGGQSNCFLSMYLHDCTFDVGCVMNISNDLIPSNGALKIGSTTRKAPDMQVFLFANTYTFKSGTTDGGFNDLMKKPVTLTIKSGKFGRILSNRVTGVGDSYFKTRYVVGNPNNPLTCIVNVDIDPETSTGDWNTKGYVDDIAFLCAGMTQGAEYADVQFNIKRGKITTLVGAMQGNTVNTSSASLSNSSYFGRTETNILAENDNDVTIYRYYAACFGRMTKGQFATANAAFYGKSTLNMYGGTIENGAYVSAGGVSGLVSPYNSNDYTNDQYIPYVDNTSTYRNYPYMGVKYQSYDSNKEIVHVKSMLHRNDGEEPEDIDLSETVTQMNIYGGVVRGGVFGGSYGFSPELMVDYAMEKGGAIWGETNVNIYGGHIYDGVYGGGEGSSNFYNLATAANRDKFTTVATVYGNTNVNIYGGIIEGGIYGGGKGLDSQTAGTKVTITTTDGTDPVTKDVTTVANEFLDIAKVYGNTNVIIDPRMPDDFDTPNPSWTFTGNIYGGGAMGAVTGNTNVQILGGNITGNVYAASAGEDGHPNKGKIVGDPGATLVGGTISENVYGGGKLAPVEGNPVITLAGGTISQDIFGGGDEAPVTGNPLVEAQFGSVNDIFAGGRGATAIVTGDPKAYINKTDDKALTVRDVYGGGDAANVVGTANVQLDKGTVATVYGGGNAANVTNTDVVINGGQAAMAFAGGHGDKDAEPQKEANVTGDAQLTIHGGTVAKAFAGSNSKGSIAGTQTLLINKTGDALAELHVTEAYGGGNQADGKAGTIEIGCTGEGETEGIGDLFGGAREANISGNIALTLEAGKIGRIFGGNNVSGNVAGTITVNIAENTTKYACGLHAGSVYGGGQDAAYTAPAPGTYPVVNINGGSIANDVFGGGLGVTAVVTGSPVVTVNGGEVSGSVYGGGALANVTGNTKVDLLGGTIGNSYGGGLGSRNGINGATADVAALVYGDAITTLNGSKVTGSIFGANNINGTPLGHVKVHVLQTKSRGQANRNVSGNENNFDVKAVYGGGNQAAYVPTGSYDVPGCLEDKTKFAEVLIENCDNSIAYVYGGGNAAPVPATRVTIYGANAIDNAFAGGNGLGGDNDGADIGYLGFYSLTGEETPKYGYGETDITVYGGTVNNVYGGSNTLGYVRTHAYVNIMEHPNDYHGTQCDLHVGNTYAGGNEAEMFCGGSMTLACSEGAGVVFAGSNNADIHGNLDLVITSGTYGQIFGGNNEDGNVYGHIQIDIDETGCFPIMIGELYGCGNKAAYSVYGYEGKACKTEGEKLYNDPTINLISFTKIGKVFGGGLGESAKVYGNPTININPIKGKFAGNNEVTPSYVLNSDNVRVTNSEAIEIPDAVGTIGTIYGGGNEAAVYGNTTVNIATKATNNHLNAEPGAEAETVDAIITGNVYGGGSQADVHGDTNVTIGPSNTL